MPLNSFSQAPSRAEPVITVSALNQAVAQLLERNFPLTWVAGEISNFTRATSGHWYFTLKDSGAQVRAVMFRGRAQYASFVPREGDKVEVRALVGLYTPRGDYQINVEAIRRAGVGNLFEAFLQLKAKLEAEGLFDPSRKRPLPRFVKKLAVVTSPQAAALRDVLSTIQRRAPHVEVHIFPCPVQGDGAGAKIAQAIASAGAELNEHGLPTYDLLLLCRGGGSIEDLWAFNEEIVARTIVHSAIPVISGVGHETDFTIADFVADLRAPTPTAAAELAVTPRLEWLKNLLQLQTSLQIRLRRQIESKAQALDLASHRLLSPLANIANKRLQVRQSAQSLRFAAQTPVAKAHSLLTQLHTRLRHQRPQVNAAQAKLIDTQRQISKHMRLQLSRRQLALSNMQAALEMLNPQRTLERGYVILRQQDGQLVRAGSELRAEQTISIRTAVDTSELQIKQIANIAKTIPSN